MVWAPGSIGHGLGLSHTPSLMHVGCAKRRPRSQASARSRLLFFIFGAARRGGPRGEPAWGDMGDEVAQHHVAAAG